MKKTVEKVSASALIPIERIENKVLLIRGEKVMLDRDLAELYGIETRALNQAVKRNKERFPADFMFQLTRMETEFLMREGILADDSLRSQFVTLKKEVSEYSQSLKSQFATLKSKRGQHIKHLPYVFTEQGVAMLSSVLKSKKAIEVNIAIMRAFVKIRQLVYSYKDLADKIAKMEKKYDKQIGRVFKILTSLASEEKDEVKEIGFKAG